MEILKRFRMLDYKEITTPMEYNLKILSDDSYESVDATMYRQMIGSLMYLMKTGSDICFAMNTLSQFLTDPRHIHSIDAKHVLRYLKGTVDYGLKYDVIRRLTYIVMLIHIGKVVPLTGIAPQVVASVWGLA